MKKYLLPAFLAVLLLVGVGGIVSPYIPLPDWGGIVVPIGPVTMVVVIEESGDRANHRAQEEAVMGKTSQALRKLNKFRLFDAKDSKGVNHLPEQYKPLYDSIKPEDLPHLWLFHGGKQADWNGKVPEGEAAIADLLKKQGGY